MCDTSSPEPEPATRRSVSRRSVLGAALAGTGVAVASVIAASGPANARTLASSLIPALPVLPSQPSGTGLTLLGTAGGPQAEYGRTGTSSVLTVEGKNYLIDAGRSSVTQYLESGLRFSALSGMFLTHLHADHLADYYNYFLLEGGQPNAENDRLDLSTPLPVFGPGPAGALPQTTQSYPTIAPQDPTPGLKALTERLNEGYAYSYNLFMRGDGTQDIRLLEQDINEIGIPAAAHAGPTNTAPLMDPFKIHEDDRVRVSAILVPHGSVFPAFAFRFDTDKGAVVFSGDTSCPGTTAATNNVIKLAQGADVLVHEVMNWDFISTAKARQGQTVDNDPLLAHLQQAHTTTEQVAQVAQTLGVPKLVLTHLIPSNPLLVPDVIWKAKIASGYAGSIHVGSDRDQMALPVRR